MFRYQSRICRMTNLPFPNEMPETATSSVVLNDVQSRLNETHVSRVLSPMRADELPTIVRQSQISGKRISLSGGCHAMGAQQFGTGQLHLDLTKLNTVESLDRERGLVTVEAGIMWPQLIAELQRLQPDDERYWTIREKQTGVDNVTIGGSLSANMHGRGLVQPPFVGDIEAFDLIDASGRWQHCSRFENSELFSLAIGGYGLFGIVARVTLRLVRRFKIRRHVRVMPVRELLPLYLQRVLDGFTFGDCQYSIDLTCDAEEHPGVCAFYQPVSDATPVTSEPIELTRDDWARLYRLIRIDKPRAFDEYACHYLRTEGQVYWSDTHQLAGNFEGHREAVEATKGTEMITEAYVAHDDLVAFTAAVRGDLLANGANVSYGTIRFIEPDVETFLPWAKRQSVCIVCNLHVRHTPVGIAEAKGHFRRILDRVVEFGGSFYLTYHRWATPVQVEACYPEVRNFFRLKRKYDPAQMFQSDWYRTYAPSFA